MAIVGARAINYIVMYLAVNCLVHPVDASLDPNQVFATWSQADAAQICAVVLMWLQACLQKFVHEVLNVMCFQPQLFCGAKANLQGLGAVCDVDQPV